MGLTMRSLPLPRLEGQMLRGEKLCVMRGRDETK